MILENGNEKRLISSIPVTEWNIQSEQAKKEIHINLQFYPAISPLDSQMHVPWSWAAHEVITEIFLFMG